MHERTPPRARAALGLGSLIGEALRGAGDLLGKEIRLFQVEVDGNIRALAGLIARFGLAVILLVGGQLLLILALVKALGALIGSEAVAALCVGGLFAAVTGLFLVLGLRRMSLDNLAPRRTELQLARDAEMLGGAKE
ncbi:phage holin family protein [Methylobacterium nigriterrae]|uniref:phage holin family protein n=1 Tax=Methylobacterium nigriterrae TaxID=3127512 RepID=UPI003013CCB0